MLILYIGDNHLNIVENLMSSYDKIVLLLFQCNKKVWSDNVFKIREHDINLIKHM